MIKKVEKQAVERWIRQLAETHPRQARVLAAVALAGAAVLVLARTNPMHLTFFCRTIRCRPTRRSCRLPC